MSNPYTGSVAAALRKAQLLLDLEAGPRLQAEALQEAVVLHLWRGVQSFLAETAFQLQLGEEPQTPEALASAAERRGTYSAEAQEMRLLLSEPDSWLSQLNAVWQSLWQFQGGDSAAAEAGGDIIAVSSRPAPELNAGVLREWRSALNELVTRHRAQSQEW